MYQGWVWSSECFRIDDDDFDQFWASWVSPDLRLCTSSFHDYFVNGQAKDQNPKVLTVMWLNSLMVISGIHTFLHHQSRLVIAASHSPKAQKPENLQENPSGEEPWRMATVFRWALWSCSPVEIFSYRFPFIHQNLSFIDRLHQFVVLIGGLSDLDQDI